MYVCMYVCVNCLLSLIGVVHRRLIDLRPPRVTGSDPVSSLRLSVQHSLGFRVTFQVPVFVTTLVYTCDSRFPVSDGSKIKGSRVNLQWIFIFYTYFVFTSYSFNTHFLYAYYFFIISSMVKLILHSRHMGNRVN